MFKPWNRIIKLAVKQVGKRAVYVNNGLEYKDPKDDEIWNVVIESITKLYPDTWKNYVGDLIQSGLFFFDTEEEQYKFYKIFEQPLTDSSAIYAKTFDENGNCETENT